MSIILVEGCDGSGKTTLIERARENQVSRYFIRVQASRYQPDLKTAFKLLNWLKHGPSEINIILDRLHFISDRVYGPVLRNEDIFKDLPLNFGLQTVAAIVYCRPTRENIHKNARKNGQMEGVIKNLDTLIDRYDTLMARLKEVYQIPIRTYDYEVDDPKTFWDLTFADAFKNELGFKIQEAERRNKGLEKKNV